MAYDDAPKHLKDFLFYLDVISGKSQKTVYEYYLDLRFFLKFMTVPDAIWILKNGWMAAWKVWI